MKHSGIWFHTHYDTEDEHTHATVKMLYAFVSLWFVAAVFGGMADIFAQQTGPPLPIAVFLVVPIAGFTLAYAVSPRVRTAVDQIPLWEITIAHVWRFVGIGFVTGAVMRVLPPQFGYPEGLGDIMAALLCIPLALAIRRGKHSPRLRASFIAWNIFGLADLLSAITVGILYSTSSFGVLRTDISTRLLTTFPVSLIPTFFVPLFILLHLLSLKRSGELAGRSR
jgi:hypothetical protein